MLWRKLLHRLEWVAAICVASSVCHAAVPEAEIKDRQEPAEIVLAVPMLVDSPAGTLGGNKDAQLILRPDVAYLQRIVTTPADLHHAVLDVHLASAHVSEGSHAKIVLHRMLREVAADTQPVAGKDYDETILATIDLAGHDPKDTLNFGVDLAGDLVAALGSASSPHGYLLSLADGGPSSSAEITVGKAGDSGAVLQLTVTKHPSAELFDYAVRPREGVYARANEGHLYYGPDRLRLWGVNRHDSVNLDIVDRLWKVGFNAVRLWPMELPYDNQSAARGEFRQMGTPSGDPLDEYDRFIAELKHRGMFAYPGVLDSRTLFDDRLRAGLLADNSFLAGAGSGKTDWEDWRAAVKEKKIGLDTAMYFDPRCLAAMKQSASNVLQHRNPYTGKRYAEEEAIVAWQVQNENGFVYRVLDVGISTWPKYFQHELQARWNQWLKQRYGNQQKLVQAWGELPVDQSIDTGSVVPGPFLGERAKYPQARAGDFVHFMVDLVVTFNTEYCSYCRSFAPAGVGVHAVPFIFDTQFRPSIPWLASQALSGDAVSVSTYEWALTSHLTVPPSLYVLDSSTVQGKLTFVYETNTASPNAFRCEFPFRVTALACRQDWDAVFWHIYHAPNETNTQYTPDERYLTEKLDYITKESYWTGTHFGPDPVMIGCMATAGRMFLTSAIPPAPSPAIYHAGPAEVFSYRNVNGISQHQDPFTVGSRIQFDADDRNGSKVDRPVQSKEAGDPVVYDPASGTLTIDTPTAKAYVGQTGGRHRFQNGIAVGDFSTPFVAFAMVSRDGKPLAADNGASAYVSAFSNAKNTGFDIDLSIAREGGGFIPPVQLGQAIRNFGRAPIQVDPVGYHLWLPTTARWTLDGFDFALRKAHSSSGQGNNLVDKSDPREVFLSVLNIAGGGAPAKVPDTQVLRPVLVSTTDKGSLTLSAVVDVWNPLPEVHWNDDYSTVHQKMRDGSFPRSGVTGTPMSPSADASFVVSDAELLFASPANISISFTAGQMHRIVATFTQPPVLSEVVAAYEKQFGKPVKKQLVSAAYQTSTVQWVVPQKQSSLGITLTESQGSMEIVYELAAR